MASIFSWISNRIKFLKDKFVGLTEAEPDVPPPWSLESPFEKWSVYSQALLCASVLCFLACLILQFYKRAPERSPVPSSTLVRKMSADPLRCQTISEPRLLERWRYNFILMVVLCLFISVPWEWYRLYKIEVAKKTTILSEGYARSCYQADLTFWETLKIWLSWNFSWDTDSCESYYKAMMVEPFWEVNPLMAISSVIWRIIIHPVELFSHTIGRSLRNIMKEIPSQWQLPVFVLFSLICISMLVALIRNCAYTKKKDIKTDTSSSRSAIRPENGVACGTCGNVASLRKSRRTKPVE